MTLALRAVTVSAPLFLSCVAYGQFSANVQGTVMDAGGAAVPNAAVTLHNTASGTDLKAQANGSGFYRFTSVAPGAYELTASSTGFKASVVKVTVRTDETRGVDVSLVAGAQGEITVTSAAPTLNPEETRVQATIDAEQIAKLPLPNRDIQEVIALAPGVTGHQNPSPASGYGSSIFAQSYNPPYHGNGAGTQGNLYLIDDLPVNDALNNGQALIMPNSDMVAEVALQTQTYSVENGTAASIQTAFTTKSGSNRVHGSVDYSYASANVGAATQPLTNVKAPFHQNMLLLSAGGPVWRDRTFFFGSLQKQNSAIGGAGLSNNILSTAFGTWAAQQFPTSGFAQGLAFAPPDRLQPSAVAANTVFASQLTGGIGATCGKSTPVKAAPTVMYNIPCDLPVYYNKALFNQAQPFNALQWNLRLDQTFHGGADRLYVMYERIDQTLGNLSMRSSLDASSPSQNKYGSINYIHTFTPRLLNEIHLGNIRSIQQQLQKDLRAFSLAYNEQGIDTANGSAFVNLLGYQPLGGRTSKVHTYAIRDTVSYVIGNHAFRGGYQFYRGDVSQDDTQNYGRPYSPSFNSDLISLVSNTAKMNSYGLYTIGGDGQFKPQFFGASSIFHGVFVEDTWKVRPNVTLTAGIRYDNFGNPAPYGRDAQPFAPLFPGMGDTFGQRALGTTTRIADHAFLKSQNYNFMPRVGFAVTPVKGTLLRGGVGLFMTAPTPYQIGQNLPTQPPNRISLSIADVLPFGDYKTLTAPFGRNLTFPTYGVAPSGAIYSDAAHTKTFSADLNGFDPELKPEKMMNFSFGIEQQLKSNAVLGLTYVGSHGYDLIAGSVGAGAGAGTGSSNGSNNDYNLVTGTLVAPRANTSFGKLNYGRNSLSSNYNALVVTLRHNYHGLTYQANYTWSRTLQYAPTVSTSTGKTLYLWTGPNNPHSMYGPSQFDVTSAFAFGGGYEVPKFFKNGFANVATANWRISSLIVAQTGTPFTVTNAATSVDYQYNGGPKLDGTDGVYGYPDYLGQQRVFGRGQLVGGVFGATKALSVAQFPLPAGVGTRPVVGNQGVNTFREPGYFTVNAGLSKGFTIPVPGRVEGVKLFLRGEAVNLLNRTNWNAIINDVSDANFGKVNSAQQKRYLQLGGRLEF